MLRKTLVSCLALLLMAGSYSATAEENAFSSGAQNTVASEATEQTAWQTIYAKILRKFESIRQACTGCHLGG